MNPIHPHFLGNIDYELVARSNPSTVGEEDYSLSDFSSAMTHAMSAGPKQSETPIGTQRMLQNLSINRGTMCREALGCKEDLPTYFDLGEQWDVSDGEKFLPLN